MTQTVGRTRRSVCRLRTDVGKDRDPGSAESGRQCTAGTKWDQERTHAVHHTRSELEEMLRDRFGRTGTGRPDTSGTTAAPFQTDRRTFQAPNQNVVIHRVEGRR